MVKMGRPSKIGDDKLHIAIGMAKMGATDPEIANAIGVSRSTLNLWKEQNKDFSDAQREAKEEADAKVEAALYKMATGFEYKAKKPMVVGDGGGEAHVEIVEYDETVLPNTTSMIFWLKNRQPAKWRDKQEMEHSGGIGVTIVDDVK